MSSEASSQPKTRIAIFASGSGSNALKFMETFADHPSIEVSLIVANKPDAGVLKHAAKFHVPSIVITKRLLSQEDLMMPVFRTFGIDFIVLAGFLLMIPEYLVRSFNDRMVNIHPALLPKYGGKGMYGMNVHNAVRDANEQYSGITIHWVNEHYDEGGIIAQYKVELSPDDEPSDIARKVQVLEHEYYPKVVESVIVGDS